MEKSNVAFIGNFDIEVIGFDDFSPILIGRGRREKTKKGHIWFPLYLDWYLEPSTTRLSPSERYLVVVILGVCSRHDGVATNLNTSWLGTRSGLKGKSIPAALTKMIEIGLIECVPSGGEIS